MVQSAKCCGVEFASLMVMKKLLKVSFYVLPHAFILRQPVAPGQKGFGGTVVNLLEAF